MARADSAESTHAFCGLEATHLAGQGEIEPSESLRRPLVCSRTGRAAASPLRSSTLPSRARGVQLILRQDMTERWHETLIARNRGTGRYRSRRRSCGRLRTRYVL